MGMNATRAEWAERAIDTFMWAAAPRDVEPDVNPVSRKEALRDLLCDLMHWCQLNGEDFTQVLFDARYHFNFERRAEHG